MAASTDDGSSSWWKAALLAVGAAIAAVVAWGWLSPEPPPVTQADEDEVVEDDSSRRAGPEDRTPPAWVKPTILWTIGIVVALAAAFALLGILKHVVMWIVLALFFSFALEPAVNACRPADGGAGGRRDCSCS